MSEAKTLSPPDHAGDVSGYERPRRLGCSHAGAPGRSAYKELTP